MMGAAFNLGSLFVLVPIFILSLVSVFIIIERLLYFSRLKKKEDSLFEQLKHLMKRGNFDEALKVCEENSSPISRLAKTGIENRYKPREEMKELVAAAASIEIPILERFISPLGTISHIAPLMGLLGTVTGNIKAFGLIGGELAQDKGVLAPAIGEALYTTAAGIMVAIPAIIFYNHFVNKVNYTIVHLENRVNELVSYVGG